MKARFSIKMKALLIFLIVLILSKNSLAQDNFNAGNSFTVLLGIRNYKNFENGTKAKNLDFFEYVSTSNPATNSDVYLGFELKKQINKKNTLNIISTTHDDIFPINFEFSFCHFLNKNLSLGLGINHYKMPKDYNPPFKKDFEFQNYIYDENNLYQYSDYFINNNSLFINPSYRIRKKYVWLEGTMNMGMGSLAKNTTTFLGKSSNSYEVMSLKYNSMPSIFVFAEPKLLLAVFPIQFKKSGIGFQLQGTYMPTQRRYNYKRRVDIWTDENPIFENIKGPRHNINRLQLDFGLVWKN